MQNLVNDIDVLKTVVWALVGVVGLLLAVAGFLIQRLLMKRDNELHESHEQQKVQLNKLERIVETVSSTVVNLERIVQIIQSQQNERDPRTERRLNVHSTELKVLSNRLTAVETKCKFEHDKTKE